MKIPTRLLAAMALTLGASVSLTSCKKDEVLVIQTDAQGNKIEREGALNYKGVLSEWFNNAPDNCPNCGMG